MCRKSVSQILHLLIKVVGNMKMCSQNATRSIQNILVFFNFFIWSALDKKTHESQWVTNIIIHFSIIIKVATISFILIGYSILKVYFQLSTDLQINALFLTSCVMLKQLDLSALWILNHLTILFCPTSDVKLKQPDVLTSCTPCQWSIFFCPNSSVIIKQLDHSSSWTPNRWSIPLCLTSSVILKQLDHWSLWTPNQRSIPFSN